ncbi:MAG: alpha/beta fold hydrolase [Actinomycetota bacterium]
MHMLRSDDAQIAYDIDGEGDPLLLIMGLGADRRMWMLQMPVFTSHYRCITFDNRGVGDSVAPPGPFSMEQMAADALAVLDETGVERAHVLGISMGGAIAQHLALKSPERVRSLALASTWCSKNPYTQRMSEIGRMILSAAGQAAITRTSMLWLFTPKFILDRDHFVQQIEQMALQFATHPEVFDRQLGALLEHDVRDELARLDVPTLVMCGRRDIMVPPELSEELAGAIPGAELAILEGGHAYNVEEFDAFNKTVLDFFASH